MNFAQTAAEIARKLSHGCAPTIEVSKNINTVEELYVAMEAAAMINDEDNSIPCFGPWTHEQEGILTHTTGSGRMKLTVSDAALMIEIFSKSYYYGNLPLARLTFSEEIFFEIVDESVVKDNIYRLFGLVDVMPAIMDFQVFFTAVSSTAEDRIFLLDAFLKRFQTELKYHNERYPKIPNDWAEKIEKIEQISKKEFHTTIDVDFYEEKYA